MAFKFNFIGSLELTIQEALDKLNKCYKEITIITDNVIINNDEISEDKEDMDKDKRIRS